MHELGIVYHIIRDVENVARANGVSRMGLEPTWFPERF